MSDPPSETPVEDSHVSGDTDRNIPQLVLDRISNREFTEWYSEQQFQTNILEGQAYFNGPSPPKDPDRHSPSKLLQCHRKASYARQNAPREGTPPEGLFWIGSEFEEEVIVPFLQDITTPETYVTNSLWIDAEIVVDGTTLQLRGSTDPAIVTSEADPVLLTEIKTTSSLDHLSEPKEHHRAQLHTYLYALNEEHQYDIRTGLIVYGCRKTLDIEVFHVEFDAEFWGEVVEWMAEQTAYEQADELPPATPEREWECSYCSFKERCGKGDKPFSDVGHTGLLPLFDGYDRQNLEEYLEAHTDANAKLTPTLAHHFPELVEGYGAYDWSCPRCDEMYPWNAIDWDGNTSDPPLCPACLDDGELLTLSGPDPSVQHQV